MFKIEKSALIVIDFINDIVYPDMGKPIAEFVEKHAVIPRANEAMRFAREHDMPIILVKVGFSADYADCPKNSPVFAPAYKNNKLKLGTLGTEFHEALGTKEQDFIVVKHRVSAFYQTKLEQILHENNIEKLVICGVSTDMAVQLTAREAHDRDYQVTVIGDACGAQSLETHQAALKMLERVATITTVSNLNKK